MKRVIYGLVGLALLAALWAIFGKQMVRKVLFEERL